MASHSSGLYDIWTNNLIGINSIVMHKNKLEKTVDKYTFIVLTINQMFGIFISISYGMLVSFLTYFIEILYFKISRIVSTNEQMCHTIITKVASA